MGWRQRDAAPTAPTESSSRTQRAPRALAVRRHVNVPTAGLLGGAQAAAQPQGRRGAAARRAGLCAAAMQFRAGRGKKHCLMPAFPSMACSWACLSPPDLAAYPLCPTGAQAAQRAQGDAHAGHPHVLRPLGHHPHEHRPAVRGGQRVPNDAGRRDAVCRALLRQLPGPQAQPLPPARHPLLRGAWGSLLGGGGGPFHAAVGAERAGLHWHTLARGSSRASMPASLPRPPHDHGVHASCSSREWASVCPQRQPCEHRQSMGWGRQTC